MALYVNGEKIEDKEIENEIARLRPHYEQIDFDLSEEKKEAQLRQWSRETVIETVLLTQSAFRETGEIPPEEIEKEYESTIKHYGGREKFLEQCGLTEDQEDEVKADIAKRMRLGKHIQVIQESAVEPCEEDIQNFFNEHLDQFSEPETVQAAHIIRHIKPGADPPVLHEEMKLILKKIRAGADFTEIAEKHSDCPEDGGNLGMFARGQMVRKFDEAVFALEVGEVSEVFRTEFGFHIAKVFEKIPSVQAPIDKVSRRIKQELIEQNRQKAVEDYVDIEREKATIEDRSD